MNTPTQYYKATTDHRECLIKEVVGDRPHEFIEDFLITDGWLLPEAKSVILHTPSGMWRGMTMEYEEAKRKVRGMSLEEQQDTVVWLHECQ